MPRIRSIKPEFPQSETVGKLSRDARLLFLQLFTLVDDQGRCRASPRMLASLLYPYDGDAGELIENWLVNLSIGGFIRRYAVDGTAYLDIPKWLKHQQISHPTPSRLPPFPETSGNFRRGSGKLRTDLGSSKEVRSKKEQGAHQTEDLREESTPWDGRA